MGRPLRFAFTNVSPALRQPHRLLFGFFERQKAKKGLLWNRFLYISLQKSLAFSFAFC